VSAYNDNGEGAQSSTDYARTKAAAPTGVSATAEGGSSNIRVSWNSVSSADYYKVYRSESSDSGYEPVSSYNYNTFYTDMGLSSNTIYYYKVSSYQSYGYGDSALSGAVFATTMVAAPSGVSATAEDSSSITVSWDEVDGASGYRVHRSTSSSSSATYTKVGSDTTGTSYTDTELSSNTTYYYKVSAYNDNGEGAQSSTDYARTKMPAPSSVDATAASSSSIRVSWDSVSIATYYYVYRSDSSEGNYASVLYNGTSNTSYTDMNLPPNTTYYYKVSYSYDYSYEESELSPAAFATTMVDAPSNVRVAETSSSSITVLWDEVGGASGYKVYRSSTDQDDYTQIGSDITEATSYTDDTGLSSNTTYYYKVSAYNDNGEGAQSESDSATTMVAAPSNVSATSASSSSITVSWAAVSGASGYKVYRSTSSDSGYTQANSSDITETSYTDTGLSSNTTYYYKVSAYNDKEEGAQSESASAMTDSP
jgi:fibronectin type 3 domain-containing protein